jgi:hypothetical protein
MAMKNKRTFGATTLPHPNDPVLSSAASPALGLPSSYHHPGSPGLRAHMYAASPGS